MPFRKPDQGGAAAVEFVLIFPLLLLILWSIVDFGLLLNARLVVTTAAREGARRAAVEGGASPAVLNRIKELLQAGGLEPDRAEVEIGPERAAYGSNITLRVTYPYPLKTALGQVLGYRAVKLTAQVTTRSEKLR